MGISTTRSQRVTLKPIGSHSAEAISSGVSTLVIPSGANVVALQVETDDVRFTLDGTTPVAGATGFLLRTTDPIYIVDCERDVTIKVTRETTDAVLQVQFGEGAG